MLKATSRALQGAVFLTVVAFGLASAANAATELQAKGSNFLVNGKLIDPRHYRDGLQPFVRFSELFIVPIKLDDARSLVLVRRPSRSLPMHRCSAGHEDFLALVRHRGNDLMLLDKIALQSCENSIDLDLPDATEPDEIVSALKIDGDVLSFSVVEPTSNGDIGAPQKHLYRIGRDHFIASKR